MFNYPSCPLQLLVCFFFFRKIPSRREKATNYVKLEREKDWVTLEEPSNPVLVRGEGRSLLL